MSAPWNGLERRSTPRVPLTGGQLDCRLIMRARVKVLDLSATGALISADAFLPTGAVGQISTALGTGNFAPIVEVLRNDPGPDGDRRALGVRFQSMDDRSRDELESFLKRAAR